MRTNAKLTLPSLLATLAALTSALADTNVIYFFVDSRGAMGYEAKARAYERQMEAAKMLPECRPAELDPQGHWGEISAGLQLSARFPTNVFTTGQPITLSVILRNTTTNALTVPGPLAWFMDLAVVTQDDKPLRQTKSPKWLLTGGGDTGLLPLSQTRLTYTLNEMFDLATPGKYRVYAERRSPQSSDLATTRSGTAELTVIKAEKE